MTTFTIDTDKLLRYAAPVFIILLICAMCVNYAYYKGKDDGTATTPQIVYVTPTPTPVPTASPTPVTTISTAYWTDPHIISSMSRSSGFNAVTTREGMTLNVPYSLYEYLNAGDNVEFHITGSYVYWASNTIVYYVDDVRVIYRDYYNYPDSYYYYGRYYDGYTGNEIGWKNVHGAVINGRPPRYNGD